jgi:hypothetical protein
MHDQSSSTLDQEIVRLTNTVTLSKTRVYLRTTLITRRKLIPKFGIWDQFRPKRSYRISCAVPDLDSLPHTPNRVHPCVRSSLCARLRPSPCAHVLRPSACSVARISRSALNIGNMEFPSFALGMTVISICGKTKLWDSHKYPSSQALGPPVLIQHVALILGYVPEILLLGVYALTRT